MSYRENCTRFQAKGRSARNAVIFRIFIFLLVFIDSWRNRCGGQSFGHLNIISKGFSQRIGYYDRVITNLGDSRNVAGDYFVFSVMLYCDFIARPVFVNDKARLYSLSGGNSFLR